MHYRADFLIIGSGIAGLTAAYKLAALGTVHVVTKKKAVTSNTNYAQGGIAAVVDAADSFSSHVADTLKAGAHLNNEDVVRAVVAEGPARIDELKKMGVRFSGDQTPDLGLEGGHSNRRVLHAGDLTGKEIERALLDACRNTERVKIFEDHAAVDLICESKPESTQPQDNRCLGAYALEHEKGTVHTFTARAVLLATGGAGRVYLYTSNPDIATGDGMAMAYRAGAQLRNLEFVQFHPTCLYNPASVSESGRRFLLSEALRGEGGALTLPNGDRFMHNYDKRGELASRDIVARAIDAEMKKRGEDHVLLDMTHKDEDYLKKRFPTIYAKCKEIGLNIAQEPIPVVPAAHFFCGGVHTDLDGQTTLPGLYALGETAHTGLHGANRLASNSLLEGAAFAHRVYSHISSQWKNLSELPSPEIPAWDTGDAQVSNEAVLIEQDWQEIRQLMWNYVGIVRSTERLERARDRLRVIGREIAAYYWKFLLTRDLIELRNIALLADLIVVSARERKESRGLHYTNDFPEARESEKRDTILTRYYGGRVSLGPQEAARPV
jgi:L-aspartate oxidase